MTDSIRVEVDWAKNGSWTDPGDDVTDLVRARQGALTCGYGRDQVTALAPTVSGRGSFVLDNADRRFSPLNPASPLFGKLKPARPVRVTRTVAGVEHVLFHGHTDDTPISPDLDARSVSLTLVDHLADFRGQNISTALHRGVRTGRAIGLVLDACGWPADLRDLDAGATVIPWWWEDNGDAATALENLIRSEGPPALLTMGADGEVVFRDRHHRLQRSRSLTISGVGDLVPDTALFPAGDLYPGGSGAGAVWRASGTVEPVMQRGFTYDAGWSGIVNAASVSVEVLAPRARQVVWTHDETVALSAGESTVISAAGTDPSYNAAAEYTVVAGSVTVQLLRASGVSIPILLTAGPSGAWVTGLQLRANPVTVASTVLVSARDEASVADYGPRGLPGDLPWCGPGDARAVCQTAVATRAQPVPVLSVRFLVGRDEVKAAALLARDLSDRVRVVEPETALDHDFYVEQIGHEATGVHDHAMTFGVEAAPVQVGNALLLDTAGRGLDQGYLANPFIDPANLLVLDSASTGHKLNSAVLAA